jgi:hypothetical protein
MRPHVRNDFCSPPLQRWGFSFRELTSRAGTILHSDPYLTSSFRGTLRAEESLFPCAPNKEGFLTSFGVTTKGIVLANRIFRIDSNRTPGRGH